MEIPKQLQNPDFRFVLLGAWDFWKNSKTGEEASFPPEMYEQLSKEKEWKPLGKAPYERNWQNKGYAFNDPKLLKHKFNYGIIGGYGNLIILDKDDPKLDIDIDTFTVETGTGGRHYYLISNYKENHVFINEYGEVRANNYQVVAPGSTHPNGNVYKIIKDVPIKHISKEDLYELIKPYLREEASSVIKINGKDTSGSGLEFRRVLAMIREKKPRELIYKEMMNYRKWSSSGDDYRNTTYNKAMDVFIQESDKRKEKIPDNSELKDIYNKIIEVLKEYCDIKEKYYPIIACWIIGTYFHESFISYPFLFLNAIRGGGKSRLLRLIAYLSKDGVVLNSLTEAEMFRSKGTLAIDEFECLNRKGTESLRELLNSAYKRGAKVRRMRKVKTVDGETQKVEEFDVYRPVAMANITGIEDVLHDRSICLIIEKSVKTFIVNKIELFEFDEKIKEIKAFLNEKCRVSSVEMSQNIYKEWNIFITSLHTLHTTHYTHYTTLYNKINDMNINGRELEMCFPLIIIAEKVNVTEVFDILKELMLERREESRIENWDISLYDFLSQEIEDDYFHSITEITRKFSEFLRIGNSTDLNAKWMGIALKRLNLIKEKKRKNYGIEVRIDFQKAKDMIEKFK
jgi:hypothetical protein